MSEVVYTENGHVGDITMPRSRRGTALDVLRCLEAAEGRR